MVETTPTLVTLLCIFVLFCIFTTTFSTGSEENFVEIMGKVFTKLLQTHTYNTLHT